LPRYDKAFFDNWTWLTSEAHRFIESDAYSNPEIKYKMKDSEEVRALEATVWQDCRYAATENMKEKE
jgi:hypothetical protein